jgi:hypothetical protein
MQIIKRFLSSLLLVATLTAGAEELNVAVAANFYGTGRVDDWRGGGRCLSAVAAPFVWRCRNRGTMAPSPVAAHRTGHAGPHPALGQGLRPSLSEGHVRTAMSSTSPNVS